MRTRLSSNVRLALISLLILAGCTTKQPSAETTVVLSVPSTPSFTPASTTSNPPSIVPTKTNRPPTLTPIPIAPPTVLPQPEVQVELLGQIGGASEALAIQGQYAYLGVGPRLVALNILNPHTPLPLGQSDNLLGVVNNIVLVGSYAYVVTNVGHLLVLSLSDPIRPQVVGSLDLQNPALGLAVADGYAYVASGKAGLKVIDVSHPEAPSQIASVGTLRDATAVAVAGHYAYVAEGDESDYSGGLQVIDVAEQARPHVIGSMETDYIARAIAVRGDYAYITTFGMLVIDISDPNNIHQVGAHNEDELFDDIAIVDNYAFITANRCSDVLSACRRDVEIIDVTDPATPTAPNTLKSSWFGLGVGQRIVASGGVVYVATEDGLRVLDGITLSSVGEYQTVSSVGDVVVLRDLAYVVDGYCYLHIIDVREPANPTNLSALPVLEGCAVGSLPDQVVISNDYAFLSLWDYGLAVVNVHDAKKPHYVTQLELRGGVLRIAAADEHLYIVPDMTVFDITLRPRFKVLDIHNPAQPRETGSLRLQGNNYSRIIVANGYAYIGSNGRLEVVDVTDPRALRTVGEFVAGPAETDYWWSMTADGTHAYLVRRAKVEPYRVELLVIDLADPAQPKQIAALALSQGGDDVTISGGHAYVSGGGLSVVDISNPDQPREVGVFEFEGGKIVAYGDYLYMAGGEAGLSILRVSRIASSGP